MSKLTEIFVTKIYHLNCCNCPDYVNTNNSNMVETKVEAVKKFENHGWRYKRQNWYCPECIEQLNKVRS